VPPDPLKLKQQSLPDPVIRARDAHDDLVAEVAEAVDQRIARRLNAHRRVLDVMRGRHTRLVEDTDFDPTADHVVAAAWMLAGRCLSLGEALMTLTAAGHGSEVAATGRSLHEAARMLHVLLDDAEEDLAKRWLAGRTVRPKDMLAVERRGQRRIAELAARHGEPPPERTDGLTVDVYRHLSEVAHNSRPGLAGDYNAALRRFHYGPGNPPLRRAFWQVQVDEYLYEAYVALVLLFARIHGPSQYLASEGEPLLMSIRDLIASEPLLRDDQMAAAASL
jgi:hypothetical protein